jgi:hypothetical protein
MKTIIFILTLLLISPICFAQNNEYEYNSGNTTQRYNSNGGFSNEYHTPSSTMRFNSDGTTNTIYHSPSNPNYQPYQPIVPQPMAPVRNPNLSPNPLNPNQRVYPNR